MVIDPTNTTITFVKTSTFTGASPALTFDPSTGVLAAGTYTVTFRSAANGFVDALGGLLDGNSDGIAGDNYTNSFVVGTPGTVVGIPAFARGPGNTVILPNNSGSLAGGLAGIPINISNGTGVTAGSFTLQYNPSLLSITGATVNAALSGASLSVTTTTDPVNTSLNDAVITFSSPTAVGSVKSLGTLQASIPDGAASSYKVKSVLHFTSVQLNGGAIAGYA